MWHEYRNGNAIIKINDVDGTRKMFTMDDEFDFAFPVSMDISIGKKCDGGCAFCYDEATPDGPEGDLMNAKFIDTIHPYTEVAINGNSINHPQLVPFLYRLKRKNVFANMTVNQKHFEQREEAIANLIGQKLIYGLGVSLHNPTDEFIERVKKYPNAVVHVINGIVTSDEINKLSYNNLKILILGYKNKGRGHDYLGMYPEKIKRNQEWLSKMIPKIIASNAFKAIAFDNLSLEQLNMRNVIPKNQWERFYQGDEGTCSMFVNLVDKTYGVSSLVPKSEMLPITDNIDEMFETIKRITNGGN